MNWFSNTTQQRKFLISYCLLAGLSFFSTLFLQYVGEESAYTLATIEMLHNHHYFIYTIYSTRYDRPPLLIWFISPLTALMGLKYVLVASRLVTLLATLVTAAVLFGFCLKLSKNKFLAWLSVAIFLTGDLLFTRGWLAYSDSLFSLCTFSSIACLWIAVQENKRRWLIIATLSIIGAFLTKALTVYFFYGVAVFVLFVYHPNRKFLLKASVITSHVIAILIPTIWLLYVNPADRWMISDILDNAATPATFIQHLVYLSLQPLRLLKLFAPPLLIVVYLATRRRINYDDLPKNIVKILAWILL
ncbi:MAG: glycosyltransferase family 39 protein, partial [Gammaproteobacteria bacterium]|nr:glycosyltransferase family 39 protein [Gammaproteobacteria bacterium]